MSSQAPSLVVAFVLDESGSMCSQTQQTIDGVNQYVADLKKDNEGKKVLFSLTKFSSKITVLHAAELLESIPDLTSETYTPNHSTALYDAVGTTINELEKRIGDDVPALVVILTDGLENSSVEFNLAQVQEMIEAKKEKGWSFVFLGAGEDAWMTGEMLGTHSSLSFDADNMEATMRSVSCGTRSYSESYSKGIVGSAAADSFAAAYDDGREDREVDMEVDTVLDSKTVVSKKRVIGEA